MFQIFYRAKKSEVLTFLNRRGGRRTVTITPNYEMFAIRPPT